jgi:hypothetical protein
MTDPRPWPRNAEWARMDAISAANRAINNLNLAKPHVGDAQALRLIGDAIEECYKIKIALLEAREDRNDTDGPLKVNSQTVFGEDDR